MTSAELKSQKAAFVASVNACVEKLQSASSSVKGINVNLSDNNDSIISSTVYSKTGELASIINNTISQLEGKMGSVLSAVDQEIKRLEDLEEAARLAAKKKNDKKDKENDDE